jgi:hypothetical protein
VFDVALSDATTTWRTAIPTLMETAPSHGAVSTA